MPVDSHHPSYDKMLPKWRRCRDAAAGQDAIYKGKAAYLPPLYKESAADYEARLKRTPFFNASWRTIAGLVGMLFRIAPKVALSANAEPLAADVTKSGIPLVSFAQKVAEEALTVGRVGIMVDYPSATLRPGATVADVEAANLRPHLALYATETIINWRTAWLNNRHTLSMVVLAETVEVYDDDGFTFKTEPRYRVLDLFEGAYRVRLFDAKGNMTDPEVFPRINGAPLTEIPFFFVGVDETSPEPDLPPLIDLVDLNLSHFQTSADLEHGAHMTALPQPWVTGIDSRLDENGNPISAELYIGGGVAWTFPRAESQVGMLEYSGQGLQALETRLEKKEAQMAVLGARMLEQQKKAAETAEAAGIHRSGEQATLASMGDVLDRGLSAALAVFDRWAGGSGQDVAITTNREFFPASMTPEMLRELVASWQAGAISPQELFHKLQRGDVIQADADFESHQEQIDSAPPLKTQGGALGGAAGA